MAITFDAVTSSAAPSFSHTCTGSNLVLFLGVFSGADDVTAASYNGVPMTLLAKAAVPGVGEEVYLYYLANPAAGSNTVAITGGTGMTSRSISYAGVRQTGIPDASVTASITAQFVSGTITTVADNSWMIAFMRNDITTSNANGGNAQTRRGTSGSIALFDSNGPLSPAGSYAGSFITAGAILADWGLVVASFAPAVASNSGFFLITSQ